MSNTAIRTEGLTRTFGAVTAVEDLALEVPAGVAFGFLGPNGAGKTTTIRLLLGLLEPTSGRAQVLGFEAPKQAEEIRARSGALLEHSGLYERLTALDNLEFYARAWKLPPNERQARIRTLLGHFSLWERRNERVATWSRGMKQKLALARALLHRPKLLFLDEPTAGLDPVAAAALRDDLGRLVAREGATVFLTTHNLAEAEKLCSLVGVIRRGRLLSIGHPDELRARAGGPRLEVIGRGFGDGLMADLKKRPEVKEAALHNGRLIIGLRDGAVSDTAPLVTWLVGQGAQVEEVRRGKSSLEEVFLTLMEEDAG